MADDEAASAADLTAAREVGYGTGSAETRSDGEATSSSDTDDSDSDAPSAQAVSSTPIRGVGPATIKTQSNVTVISFGSVNIEGSTSGVKIGNKTEYLGPVTVQQIVHGGASTEPVVTQAALRYRNLLASVDGGPVTSAVVPRRTGLVLRGKSAGDGLGESCGRRGNGLLWKHLLGRKVDMAAWLPVAFLSCITLMAMIIQSFIFGYIFPRGDTESPTSSSRLIPHTEECSKSINIPPRPRGKRESLPNLHRSVIIARSAWFANPPKEYTPLKHPVDYVIISHTATEPCDNQEECSLQVQLVQKFHVESRHWSDIGYNFLVGGDGNSYEGRGWEYVGAHSKGYNVVSIGISFIGTFSDVLPPPAQIRACKLLIKEGVSLGKISPNYKLIGHRQVSPTESPGEKLYEELQNWEHWSPEV